MAHLSLTYHSQGRQPEAETLGLQVMELRKKVLGPEHHHTMSPIQRSQIIRAPSEEPVTGIKSVFLAGTTAAVENNGDWRENLSALLSNYPVTIFNPNRPDWDSTWREDINFGPYREKVLWELDKKVAADLVVVYLHPATLAPISLLEFGLSAQVAGKVIAIAPEGYSKRANVQIVCQKFLDTMDQVHELVIDELHLNQ
ncbi:hypothetical protein H634G_04930 [Metarhizium anisopliae BRIP 53293]|uniref:Uncharacterized protein n=1 Tax=Metarhizium anisopliae BRIP 53293 TaxID=1291518 RepID=A0A0D9NZ99_METAN|nr:hypothetical protein H634G_04930 [Metarhizium anisopliae BRIP 53293]KJK87794.1 hypothetical protein H633G_08343 [Metarhizium anisopliae BRIP 53284]